MRRSAYHASQPEGTVPCCKKPGLRPYRPPASSFRPCWIRKSPPHFDSQRGPCPGPATEPLAPSALIVAPLPLPRSPAARYTRSSPSGPTTLRCVMAKRPSIQGGRSIFAEPSRSLHVRRARATLGGLAGGRSWATCGGNREPLGAHRPPAKRPPLGGRRARVFPRRSDVAQIARLMVLSQPRSANIDTPTCAAGRGGGEMVCTI